MKISEFEIDLSKKKVTSKETQVKKLQAPEIKPKSNKRKYTSTERVLYGPSLQDIFSSNELAAYQEKAKPDAQIKYEFLKANHRNLSLKRRFKQGKVTIGTLRGLYNRHKLFSNQDTVYLVSFCYNEHGVIVENARNNYTPLYYLEVLKKCIEYKIADPRFLTPEQVATIRDRQNDEDPKWQEWSVPPQHFIDRLAQQIGKEVFDSVYFPRGHSRIESPADWDI